MNPDGLALDHSSQVDQQADLANLADHWAGLGAFCTFWNRQGEPASPVPQSSLFWKTLWNRAQFLQTEIAQAVQTCASEPTPALPLALPGLHVCCLPLQDPGGQVQVVAICYASERCTWTEEFSRLCSQCQIDEQLLHDRLKHQPRFSESGAVHMAALIHQSLQNMLELGDSRTEAHEMATQLTDTYEELNLIYGVGAMMRVTLKPRAYFTQLFEDLAKATPFTTMAAVLYDTEVLDPDNRLIIGGERLVDEPAVLRVADALQSTIAKSRKALIINRLQDHPDLEWARGWLRRAIAVPIICNESLMGVVFVFNHNADADFNSTDARLLHSVTDRTATYLENVLLYGDLNNLLMGLLHALVSSIDAKDPYTCGHSNRVALISQLLAEKVSQPALQPHRVYLGGLLHDVGKIGISELILCKPGKLTVEETAEMKKHPEIGVKILGGITQLRDIIPAVLHHHEGLNGSGYPSSLRGDDIPWIAKIVGLADAFDAMTTQRKYREALPLAAAMLEIRRCAGVQFCPKLVDALVELIDEGLDDRLKKVRKTSAFDNVHARWVRNVGSKS